MKTGRHMMAGNLWIIALILVVVGTMLILALSIQNDKNNVEATAKEELLFNTVLSATRLNSILQAADAVLELFTGKADTSAQALSDVALRIPQACNIYVVDEQSAVLATAFNRNAPKLPLDPERLTRFEHGARVEYGIIEAPSEGGTVLAQIRRIPGDTDAPHFIVALYSGQSMQGSIDAITVRFQTSARILDASGASLKLGTVDGVRHPVGQEMALDDVPLRVRFESDPAMFLAPWRARTSMIIAIVLVFAITIGLLLAYSLVQWNRAVKAEELQRQLDHQESLFREVNHRIKNNLTIVQTVLGFGADRVREHPDCAEQTLDTATSRVRAIAMLHELLYKVPAAGRQDFGLYLGALSEALQDAYGMRERIQVLIEADQGLNYSLDQMVPLALIVNELLTNSFKYAFPDNRPGRIVINARKHDDLSMTLSVQDDGVGMIEHATSHGGIGALLIDTLASQLKATIDRASNQPTGVVCTLHVPPISHPAG